MKLSQLKQRNVPSASALSWLLRSYVGFFQPDDEGSTTNDDHNNGERVLANNQEAKRGVEEDLNSATRA